MPYSSMVQSTTAGKSQGQGMQDSESHLVKRFGLTASMAQAVMHLYHSSNSSGAGVPTPFCWYLGLASELILIQFQVQNLSFKDRYMG